MSIPSNVAWVTRSMSGIGGGILRCLDAGRWKIISFVLSVLIVSLFLADQAQILSYSRVTVTERKVLREIHLRTNPLSYVDQPVTLHLHI